MAVHDSQNSGWSQIVLSLVVEVARRTRNSGLSDLEAVEIVREAVRNFEKENGGTAIYVAKETKHREIFTCYLSLLLTRRGIKNADILAEAAVKISFGQAAKDTVYIPTRSQDFIPQRNAKICAEYAESPSYGFIKVLAKKYGVTSRQIYTITSGIREELKGEYELPHSASPEPDQERPV